MSKLNDKTSTGMTCYFCSSTSITKSNKRRTINFFQIRNYFLCLNCKGFSLYPKLEQFEIESLYSTNYIKDVNPNSDYSPDTEVDRFKKLFTLVANIYNRTELKFLDYGCGSSAEVIIRTTNLGYISFGVEVEESTRTQAHSESGCKIYSPQEIISAGLQFDLIFLGDVLEHLNNPQDTLKEIHKILLPHGILIAQGPLEGAQTISNFLMSIKSAFLKGSPSYFPPYHVSLATRKAIFEVLEKANLKVQSLKVTEPLWPAPRFASKASFISFSSLIFSFTKLVDIILNRLNHQHGTRYYLEARKEL